MSSKGGRMHTAARLCWARPTNSLRLLCGRKGHGLIYMYCRSQRRVSGMPSRCPCNCLRASK